MNQALGQENTGKRSVAANMSQVAPPPSTGAITGTYAPANPAPNIPAMGQSQLPLSSGTLGTGCDPFQNGGFETGSFNPGWTIDGVIATPVVTNTQAHSGSFSGFVGDAPGFCGNGTEIPGDSSFYQQFTVPAGSSTLSFWHWDCTTDSIAFDWQDAYITDSSGTILHTIFHQCLNGNTWINQQLDMTPYAGQTVRIKFLVHGDNFGDLTGMYVDDVSLACGGGGCPPSNKIYNIGGFGTAGQTNTTRIYDIGTNTWTTGAPLPTGLSDHATAYLNGKIYVAGGLVSGAVNTLFIYDIATDSWTGGAPMPMAVFLPGFGIINGKLYIASGNNGSTEVNTLQVYDIASNTWSWSTGAVVPTPVTGPGSAVYQGKLYLYGGAAPFPTTTTITQIYDPVSNTWSSGPNMNVPRLWFYGGAVDNTSIVAPGGDTSPSIPINDNEQLTATWAVKAPLPFASRGPFAVSDGTFVYIGGGYDGSTVHADLLRYDPVANTYTPLAPSGDAHFLSQAVLLTTTCAPVPNGAVSRKVHGGAGTFDVNLPLVPIGGAVGIEDRTGAVAGAHQEVITFASAVTVASVSVTSGTGIATFSVAGPVVTVSLNGVTNAQRLGVTLHNVNDGTHIGNVLIPMGLLAGDTNASGAVSAADVAQTKAQSGVPVTVANFREDVNSSGSIGAADIALVKSKAGTSLPP